VRLGRAALSARWTNVRLQGKGLLLGLRSPLAFLMKLGVALAQPVQSRFDPHQGFDAEADLFPFVRAKPLNQLVGALETGELESAVLQVMCDITTRLPLSRLPQVYPRRRLFGWRLGEPRLRYTDVLYGWRR
jgi:hypothetical protein